MIASGSALPRSRISFTHGFPMTNPRAMPRASLLRTVSRTLQASTVSKPASATSAEMAAVSW